MYMYFNLTAYYIECYNPFPNKPLSLRVGSESLLKTLWEKEKFSSRAISPFPAVFSTFFREVSSIFIELKIVVCKLFQFGRVKKMSFGKGLNTKRKNRFNKFNEKKIYISEQHFLLFPQYFLLFRKTVDRKFVDSVDQRSDCTLCAV